MADGSHNMGIQGILSHDELALLSRHPEDIGLIRRLKLMTSAELSAIDDNFGPVDIMHYNNLQIEWIKDSRWLLGTRINRDPSEEEYMADYLANNSKRFRVFYAMKFPDRIRKKAVSSLGDGNPRQYSGETAAISAA